MEVQDQETQIVGNHKGPYGSLTITQEGEFISSGQPAYRIKGWYIDPLTDKKRRINRYGFSAKTAAFYARYCVEGKQIFPPGRLAEAKKEADRQARLKQYHLRKLGRYKRIVYHGDNVNNIVGTLIAEHIGAIIDGWTVLVREQKIGEAGSLKEAKVVLAEYYEKER